MQTARRGLHDGLIRNVLVQDFTAFCFIKSKKGKEWVINKVASIYKQLHASSKEAQPPKGEEREEETELAILQEEVV